MILHLLLAHMASFGCASFLPSWLPGAIMPIPAQEITERESLNSSGMEGNGPSVNGSVSFDGRYVAFASGASNLVSGDTNNAGDVFVRDRLTGQTVRVSVDSIGNEANSFSSSPSITADGRYVAFVSIATNLVPGSRGNGHSQVFVHDLATGQTSEISVAFFGRSFWTPGNADSFESVISADGRYIAFASFASNLSPFDTNGDADVFVHDRQTRSTIHASVNSQGDGGNNGSSHPSLSADGRFVAFHSGSSNLVPGDTNNRSDVFVFDQEVLNLVRVSVDSNGTQGNDSSGAPSISIDGRNVAFGSCASNLVSGDRNRKCDVFVHDRQTGETTRVSVNSQGDAGNDHSGDPAISADGRFVVYLSWASNLAQGDVNGFHDIFCHDRSSAETSRVSVSSDGIEADGHSFYPFISPDGRFTGYSSLATNLVSMDGNATYDTFLHGPELTLQADPSVVQTDDSLTLTTYSGVPAYSVALWAVRIGGSDVFLLLSAGFFDPNGLSVWSAIVPPGLGNLDVTFRGIGIGEQGDLVVTNDATVLLR